MKKLNISLFEFITYIVSGALALWGLVYVILGLFGMYLDVGAADNAIAIADASFASAFGLGFFGWGLIILSIGILIGFISLCVNAKKTDKEAEKAARRAARLGEEKVVSEVNPAEQN